MRGIEALNDSSLSFRQKLGKVIEWMYKHRGFNERDVARRCGVSVGTVDDWIRGVDIPTGNEWARLKGSVARMLQEHTQLYRDACAEQENEREMITKGMSKMTIVAPAQPAHKKPATSDAPDPRLTHRPFAQATLSVVKSDEPKGDNRGGTVTKRELLGQDVRAVGKDGRQLPPSPPPGSLTAAARQERYDFARGILLQRPNISNMGRDGLQEILYKRFGVGVAPDVVARLREEIKREQIEKELRAKIANTKQQLDVAEGALRDTAESVARVQSAAQPAAAQPSGVNIADMQAAVRLLLEAIPGLQRFEVVVDDKGEASVSYGVRKLVEDAGTMKVRI